MTLCLSNVVPYTAGQSTVAVVWATSARALGHSFSLYTSMSAAEEDCMHAKSAITDPAADILGRKWARMGAG